MKVAAFSLDQIFGGLFDFSMISLILVIFLSYSNPLLIKQTNCHIKFSKKIKKITFHRNIQFIFFFPKLLIKKMKRIKKISSNK